MATIVATLQASNHIINVVEVVMVTFIFDNNMLDACYYFHTYFNLGGENISKKY